MSIEAMAWALEAPGPSHAAKLLLVLLSDSADMDGNVAVYPSYICPRVMLTPAELESVLGCLELAKMIERDPHLHLPLDDVVEAGVEVIRLLYPRETTR